MSNIVIVKKLNYNNLFEELELLIEKNRFVTISGSNNCGKTTLIRILNRDLIVDNNNGILICGEKINSYTIDQYNKIIYTVIPEEIVFTRSTVEKEMLAQNFNAEETDEIIKKLKITRFINKDINTLTKRELVLSQIAIGLLTKTKILVIDDLSNYLEEKEIINVIKVIKKIQKTRNLTVIYATINLNVSLHTDYLYIINNKKIILEGKPKKVLEKDNIINKSGLELPFMVDLSVKLKDYNLLDTIELENSKVVDKLWK